MRKVSDYLALMEHGMGKTPAPGHNLIDTFNDAGRALFIAAEGPPYHHTWSWVKNASATLNIYANTTEVDLPPDFGQLLAVAIGNRTAEQVEVVDARHFIELKQAITPPSLRFFLCFDTGPSHKPKDGTPRKVAAIWPTPAASRSDVLITYSRTWRDMGANDGGLTPNVPAEYERLLALMARAYAVSYEDQIPTIETPEAAAELVRLVAFDSGKATDAGRPTYSVSQAAKGSNFVYPHRRVTR